MARFKILTVCTPYLLLYSTKIFLFSCFLPLDGGVVGFARRLSDDVQWLQKEISFQYEVFV